MFFFHLLTTPHRYSDLDDEFDVSKMIGDEIPTDEREEQKQKTTTEERQRLTDSQFEATLNEYNTDSDGEYGFDYELGDDNHPTADISACCSPTCAATFQADDPDQSYSK